MKENLKIVGMITMIFLFLVLFLTFIYGTFAGIWGYNPTDISWFNTKLVGTSFFGFVFLLFLIKIYE